ncbi:hypothetical protein N0V90_009632 [Kalmusia sp. IMI 367209]|nr:hypothetical protein N0V90_009632 [Kalmusia sp. IMI 367209]
MSPKTSRNPLKRLFGRRKSDVHSKPDRSVQLLASASPAITISPPPPGDATAAPVSPISRADSGKLSFGSSSSINRSNRHKYRPLDFWNEAFGSLPQEDQELLQEYIHPSTLDSIQTFSDILEVACKKRDLVEQKKWTVHVMGKRITVRSQADLVIRWLDRFKQVGDVAVNADPVHAGLPWAAVRFIIQAAVSDQAQLDALFTGLERVMYVLNRCNVYVQLYLNLISSAQTAHGMALENFENGLAHLYCLILQFLVLALRVSIKSSTIRFLQALWQPAEIMSFARTCQEVEERVEIELHNLERLNNIEDRSDAAEQFAQLVKELEGIKYMRTVVETLSMQVASIWKLQTDDLRSDILYWLSNVPYKDHHHHAASERTVGTGTWLLHHNDYLCWQNSLSPMILWLHGIPGAGKTKLVTHVIDDLKRMPFDDGLAYFYCNRAEDNRRSADEILRSLVKQLAVSVTKDEVHESIARLFDDKKSSGFASAKMTYEEAESLLLELIQAFPRVHIVLDALDECFEQDRSRLIDVFNRMIDALPQAQLKIFISSRRNDDIMRQLLKEANIGVEATDNEDDISRFVIDRIERDSRRRDRQSMQPIPDDLKYEIASVFGQKSGGMFQWAALHIIQLLDLERESDIRSTLGKFPEGLKEAYDAILKSIQSQRGSKADIGRRALQWIISTAELIQIHLLVEAVCQDPDNDGANAVDVNEVYVLGACQNLVVVDTDGFCRFSHLSVEEYLADNAPWSALESRQLISKVCLRSLIWIEPTHKVAPALRWYATHNWIRYLPKEYEEHTDERELDLLVHFFGFPNAQSSPYIDWWYKENADTKNPDLSTGSSSLSNHSEKSQSNPNSSENLGDDEKGDEVESTLAVGSSAERVKPNGNYIITGKSDHHEKSHVDFESHYSGEGKSDDKTEKQATEDEAEHRPTRFKDTASMPSGLWRQLWPPQRNLLFLSYHGLLAILRKWYKKYDFPLDVVNDDGHSLLVLAMAARRYKTTVFLLEIGSPITEATTFRLALRDSIEMQQTEFLLLLLERGINARTMVDTPESLQGLCRHGKDFAVHSTNALVEASYYGSLETMRILIEHGADLHDRARLYATDTVNPRHRAAGSDYWYDQMWPPRKSRPRTALEAAALSVHGVKSLFPDVPGQSLVQQRARENLEGMEFLIKRGADINTTLSNPLVAAARQGFLDRVTLLVQRGSDPNFEVDLQKSSYPSALAAAVAGDHLDVAYYLIEKGADIQAKTDWNGFHSLLAWAAYHCDVALVRLLLKKGANVNETSPIWKNPLLAAAMVAHPKKAKVVKTLLDAGADPDEGIGPGGAIQILAKTGQTELVRMLLKHKPDVNAQIVTFLHGGILSCPHGSALAAAAAEGHMSTVQLLLQQGADVNLLLESECGSALAAAAHSGQTEIVRLLLSNGADVNLTLSARFGSALEAAVPAFAIRDEGPFRLLIEKNADVNLLTDGEFGSALATAAFFGAVSAMKILLEKGAEPNLELSGFYGTALAAAACYHAKPRALMEWEEDMEAEIKAASYEKSIKPLELLLDAGAEIDTYWGNALEAAASNGNEDAVYFLCQRGADVNFKTHTYGSPLCAAAATGEVGIVELLCEEGADVDLRVGGINALAAAALSGGPDVLYALLWEGSDPNVRFEGAFAHVIEAVHVSSHPFPDEEREDMEIILRSAGAIWGSIHAEDIYFSNIREWFD